MSGIRRPRDLTETGKLPPSKKRKTIADGVRSESQNCEENKTTNLKWNRRSAVERETRFEDHLEILGSVCLRIFRLCTPPGSPPFLDVEGERWPDSLRFSKEREGKERDCTTDERAPDFDGSLNEAGHLRSAARHLLAAKRAAERRERKKRREPETDSLVEGLERAAAAFDSWSARYAEASKAYKEASGVRARLAADLAEWDAFKMDFTAAWMIASDPTFCGGISKPTLEIFVAQSTSAKRRGEALSKLRAEEAKSTTTTTTISPTTIEKKLRTAREEKERRFRAAELLFCADEDASGGKNAPEARGKDRPLFTTGRIRAKVKWDHSSHDKPLSEETWASKTTAKGTDL